MGRKDTHTTDNSSYLQGGLQDWSVVRKGLVLFYIWISYNVSWFMYEQYM